MKYWGTTAKEVLDYAYKEQCLYFSISKALVVLSGGMDSATCLALAQKTYGEVEAITFNYGQQHTIEIEQAKTIAKVFDVPIRVIDLHGLADNFNTALKKNSDLKIPEKATEKGTVPPTYVPFRNTIMLSIAAAYAQSWGFEVLIYGANIVDYSGYPDCRPDYVDAMQKVFETHLPNLVIEAPIIHLNKSEIVKLGNELMVPFEYTWSCYRGGDKACGKCPSCEYRLKGFKDAGLVDPVEYE